MKKTTYKKSHATRTSILLSAAKLFEEKGYYETTVKDIAKEAGIVHGSVYNYFKDKEAIAVAILDGYLNKITVMSDQATKNAGSEIQSFILFFLFFFKYVLMNKSIQVLFLDIQYVNYDHENFERLKDIYRSKILELYKEHKQEFNENELSVFILTLDALKVLFKGVMNGHIRFNFEETAYRVFKYLLVASLNIEVAEFNDIFQKALELYNSADLISAQDVIIDAEEHEKE